MSINNVKIHLSKDVPISRLDNNIEIGEDKGNEKAGVEKVHIRFRGHYHIEIKQQSDGEILVILTSGGITKEIDLQTFQQIITMNY